jgi:hypothetical protein
VQPLTPKGEGGGGRKGVCLDPVPLGPLLTCLLTQSPVRCSQESKRLMVPCLRSFSQEGWHTRTPTQALGAWAPVIGLSRAPEHPQWLGPLCLWQFAAVHWTHTPQLTLTAQDSGRSRASPHLTSGNGFRGCGLTRLTVLGWDSASSLLSVP